ncbi:MAG: TAXI family TRAP transporter solute-binding subunit [Pseudomonadota bacterium]
MTKMKTPKRSIGMVLAVFFLLAAVICVSGPVQAEPVRLLSGSSSTSSSHYAYAVAAEKSINEKSGDKVNVTTVATGGAVDNLERIDRGQIHFGLGTFATFYQAYKGLGKYEGKPRPKIRALWLYSINSQNYIVRADSGITSLEGLTGQKFCPGLRGSATEQLVQQLLDLINVKPDYYRGSLADAVAAVKDNRIVGYAKSGAGFALDASTQEIKAFNKIAILDWPADKVAIIQKAIPFLNFAHIPEGTNPGQPAYTTPVQCIGYISYSDSLTEEQVYALLKGIHEAREYQEAAYLAIKGFDFGKETIKYTMFPLHAGAVRYFREKGYKIPENLIPPEMK